MSKTSFAELPDATIIGICDYLEGDGHGIYHEAFLRDLHVPSDLIDDLAREHKSGDSHTETIYAPGASGFPGSPSLKSSYGVYSLDVYRRIAQDFGLGGSPFIGRGREARDLDERIRKHVAERAKQS